jgi:hypothetical protein
LIFPLEDVASDHGVGDLVRGESKGNIVTVGIKLDHHNRLTIERLFRHPTSHNIQWHDVYSLLEAIGETRETTHGSLEVKVGDELEYVAGPLGRDLTDQHIHDVRKILKAAGLTPEAVAKA